MPVVSTYSTLVCRWEEFGPALDGKNIILAPFCEHKKCEEKIKADSTREYVLPTLSLPACPDVLSSSHVAEPGAPAMGAKSLCIPFEQPPLAPGTKVCLRAQPLLAAAYAMLYSASTPSARRLP